MGFGQLLLEVNDIGVGTRQRLADLDRLAESRPCAGPIARAREQRAQVGVAAGQLVLVRGDGRVVVSQFLPDGKRCVIGRPAPTGSPFSDRTMPMLIWVQARSSWNSATSEFARASLCWIASASR